MSSSADAGTRRRAVLRGSAAARAQDAPVATTTLPPARREGVRRGAGREAAASPEAVYEAARRQGFEAGLADGAEAMRAAAADREARLAQAIASLDAAVDATNQAQAAALAVIEDRLADAAFTLTEAVFERELALCAHPGREALARALKLAPGDVPLVARLHPDDLATLGDVDDLVATTSLDVVADASVSPGGCVVSAGATEIDASLARALARARAALTEGT